MKIRPAELGDYSSIQKLYFQLNPDDPHPNINQSKSIFERIVQSDWFYILVGIFDTKIVSSCYLNLIPNLTRNASPYGIIENVITDHAYRNKGYAKAVVKHSLDFAWSRGCYKVMLQTSSRRESTHRFYRSCGFNSDVKTAYIARPDTDLLSAP